MNEGLKKFAHVNKKAFEQYNNFTKQRDQLLKRRDDLEKSGESIEQLVIQRRVDQEGTFLLGSMVLLRLRTRMMMKQTRLRIPSSAPSTTTLGWQ